MKAVFAHFHQRYGWLLPFPTNPNSLTQDLLSTGVEQAFTLAYTHKPGLSRQLNSWLATFCQENSRLKPFGAIHPLDPDFNEVIIDCLDLYNFPGMKLHCLVQQCRPDDERLDPLYEAVAERSKGMIIHASNFPLPYKDYLGIEGVSKILKRYPGLNLIIPHLGLHDLRKYSYLFNQYEGLMLDTAFVFQNQVFLPPLNEIKELMLAYPDRFIYGSDYPFIMEPTQNGINRILELDLPVENYRKLFYENAASYFCKITCS